MIAPAHDSMEHLMHDLDHDITGTVNEIQRLAKRAAWWQGFAVGIIVSLTVLGPLLWHCFYE